MAQLNNIARVSGDTEVPDIRNDSPEGIEASAKFIWTAVLNQINKATARQMDRHGQPGYIWNGTLNRVIENLFPELFISHLISKADAKEIKLAINAHHKKSNTLICRQAALRGGNSEWWVAKYWTDYRVQRIEPQNGQEPQEEELNMADTSENFPCRQEGCNFSNRLPHVRSGHELKAHGFRIQKDGTRVDLPQEPLTDEELRDLILEVLKAAPGPESWIQIHKLAVKTEPRVTRPQVRNMVHKLAEDPDCDLIAHGTSEYYTYYTLASKLNEEVETLVQNLRSEDGTKAPAQIADTPAKTQENGLFSTHITAVEKLLEDLKTLDSMELELNSDAQAMMDAKDAELAQVKEELAQVTRERDQLKKLLKGFGQQVAKYTES
jgi:hypothetical protein